MADTSRRNPTAFRYFDGRCGRADSGGQRGSTDRSHTGESLLLRRSDGQYRKPWDEPSLYMPGRHKLVAAFECYDQLGYSSVKITRESADRKGTENPNRSTV